MGCGQALTGRTIEPICSLLVVLVHAVALPEASAHLILGFSDALFRSLQQQFQLLLVIGLTGERLEHVLGRLASLTGR